jgi:hypothetical protein
MASNDAREPAVNVAENILRRIVAMERTEGNRQTVLTLPPISPLREQTVRDVAQSTVPHSESCADPVRDFADDRRVRVVHTDELRDVISHELIVGSIAEKVSVHVSTSSYVVASDMCVDDDTHDIQFGSVPSVAVDVFMNL